MEIRSILLILVIMSHVFADVSAYVQSQNNVDLKAHIAPNYISIANQGDFLLIRNNDGSIRGGAYNVSSFGGIYISSLHTLSKTRFFDINKEKYFFFGFRSINGIRDFEDSTDFYDLLARADDLDYKWLDVVFLIDKHIYPAGLIDVRVRDVFLTLATRKIGPHSSGFAINGIVPDRAKANEYILRTNQGDLFEDQKTKKLYLQVDPRKSSITQGSSGTLVLTQSKDDFYSPPQPGFDYSESIPIGILKCRVEQSVVKKDFIRFEVQTFEFLTDINLWITEFKTAPPTIFERNCVQINGRGHGGL